MKKQNQKQQGDVLLRKLNKLPIGEVKKIKSDHRGIVLAEGEVTGHYHGIEVEESDAELIRIGNALILQNTNPVTIKHQEHMPITLEAGIWQVGIVQEFDALSGMINSVRD